MNLWINCYILSRNKQWDDHGGQGDDTEFDPEHVAFVKIFRILCECSKGPDISVEINSKYTQQDQYIVSRRWSTPIFDGNGYDGHYRRVELELFMTSGVIEENEQKKIHQWDSHEDLRTPDEEMLINCVGSTWWAISPARK